MSQIGCRGWENRSLISFLSTASTCTIFLDSRSSLNYNSYVVRTKDSLEYVMKAPRKDLLDLKRKILLLPHADNLVCFLIFGSILNSEKNVNDFDAIVIVKKVDSTLNELFKLLVRKYKKLDVNIYAQEEVLNNLSFYTREFKLEYLARGLCLLGKNMLASEYSRVNEYEYKQSMLIRSIKRLQTVRQRYLSASLTPQEKITYIKKYLLRISRSILILQGLENDLSVNKLQQDEINQRLTEMGVLDSSLDFRKIRTPDEYFDFFDSVISKALIRCKKDFDLKYKNRGR